MKRRWIVTFIVFLSIPWAAAQSPPPSASAQVERLNREVTQLYANGKLVLALEAAQRALTLAEASLGPEHPATTSSLNNLAVLYESQGAYGKAEPLYRRVLATREKVLGPEHPDTATSLNNLASLNESKGAYGKAEPLYGRALAIREKVLGPEHPDTATSLNNLAGLYKSQGAYGKAEPLYQRALTIREKKLGPEHPDTADSLNDLGSLYESQGMYGKAEPQYRRALAIREKVLGPDHPDTATSLNNLAFLYKSQGASGKAEPLYQRALAIREKVLGPQHPATANSLNSLASLYESQGAYGKAEPLYQRALAIHENVLGPQHPQTATSLNNLASLYESQGAYGKAEPLYQRALAIREKVLGLEHPDTADSLNNLASLYESQGAYGKAEPLYQRALAIREKVLGPEHPDTADSLNNLAALYDSQGAYGKAVPLYQRALAIREKVLGPEHPQTADSLNNLAVLYTSQGAYGKAEPLFQRALAIYEKVLGPEHPQTATTVENLLVLDGEQGNWIQFFQELRRLNSNTLTEQRLAFGRDSERSKILQRRSKYLSLLRAPLLMPEHHESALPLFVQISLASKARMNDELRASLQSLKRRSGAENQALIDELESVGTQESALIQAGPGNRPREAYRRAYQEFHQHEDDLIAKISAHSEAFRTVIQQPAPAEVARRLHGAVLVDVVRIERRQPKPGTKHPLGDPGYVSVVLFSDGRMESADLGDAKPIDDLVAGYRKAQEVTDNQAALRNFADRLSRLVLDPLIKLAGDHREWYLSTDGPLRLIPFGALLLADGKYAAERYRMWSLGSGRDLLTPAAKLPANSREVVLANPDYGSAPDARFSALPETGEEAEAIRKVFPKAQIIAEGQRSKQTLLKLDSPPKILHLATHGYFQTAGEGGALLRSGVALDGANLGPEGVLTAQEAQSLHLNGTSLVTLSACETGVGDVSFSEGLSGLQRSIALAGARTQLLTLWPVNSARTKDFMEQFYRRLASGKTKGDAWVETQREMIRAGLPPHFWAPFVLYGDPGPL